MKSLETQVNGDHYQKKNIQPIEYIIANDLSFIEGNIVKYITRHSEKNGEADAQKVLHYVFMLLENEYGVEPKKAFDSLFPVAVSGVVEPTHIYKDKELVILRGGSVDLSLLGKMVLHEKQVEVSKVPTGSFLQHEGNWKEVLSNTWIYPDKFQLVLAGVGADRKSTIYFKEKVEVTVSHV